MSWPRPGNRHHAFDRKSQMFASVGYDVFAAWLLIVLMRKFEPARNAVPQAAPLRALYAAAGIRI